MRQNVPNETDMSETRGLLLKLIWVRRLKQSCKTHRWHWYDWDTSTQTCTDILRPPKKSSLFFILTQSQVCKIKMQEQNFFGRLSHICASSGRGVSVISVSTVGFASQSYRSQLDRFGVVILGTLIYKLAWHRTNYWKFHPNMDQFSSTMVKFMTR